MAQKVKLEGDAKQLISELRRLQKANREQTEEYREQAKEAARLERVARRAFESTRTPVERYRATVERLREALKAGRIDLDTYNRAVDRAGNEMRDGAREAEGFGDSLRSSFAGVLGGLVSISGAIGVIREGYQAWLDDARAIEEQTRKASQEVIAFAALQEGGTIADRAQRAGAAGAGVATLGESFNLVQAMQSATGSFERGLQAAEAVFDAARVGITTETGSELAVQAVSQQQDVQEFLRLAFAAGQASLREPELIGRAAPAIQQFDEKQFGFAVAGQLGGTFGQDIKTFVNQAGRALSETSGLADTFQRLGVGAGATREERLRALAGAGISSQVQLQQAGLSEIRQLQAVSNLVQAVQSGDFDRIQAGIQERFADQDIFRRTRARIEEELPSVRVSRLTEESRARFEQLRSFDEGDRGLRESQIAEALQRRRITSGGPFEIVDQEGNVNSFRLFITRMLDILGSQAATGSRGAISDQSINAAILEANERTASALESRIAVPTPTTGGE